MKSIDVYTQADLDKVVAAGDLAICRGDKWFTARDSSHVVAWDSSHVEARDSSHVVARDSSHVVARDSSHVEAWDSSHVVARDSSHVEAWDSSHVEAWDSSHVEARDSSHVEARDSSHVVAWDSSHVVARDSSHVEAWDSSHVEGHRGTQLVAHPGTTILSQAFVAVTLPRGREGVALSGEGIIIEPPPITTAAEWCDAQGVPVVDGVVVLYKAVDGKFRARYNAFSYEPGTTPAAPDWDGGIKECGGGLHFSPRPSAATGFYTGRDRRFVACPVRLEDVVVHANPLYPNKVKAPGCCAPVYEVDIHGEPVVAPESVTA